MKDARRILAVACVLITITVTLILRYWPREFGPFESQQPRTEEVVPLTLQSPSAPATPDATWSQERTEQEKEKHLASLYATQIEVYAKVVDEKANPVAGAAVQISIADSAVRTGSRYFEIAGSDGLVSLTGVRGIAFSLRASKDGYYTTAESTAHRNVVIPAEGDAHQPSKQKPIILILRKHGQPEALISVSSGQILVPASGQPINVDLSTGQPGRGDLQVASWVDDISQERYDWRYQLTLSGGGLVERKGRFDFEAPDEGYQPDVEVNMPAAVAKWSIGAERDYFARLADGRYARFVVRFYPRRRNFVVIESHVNPIPGNRNLEFAPNTRVQPSRSD
jgi:hypothetical protein